MKGISFRIHSKELVQTDEKTPCAFGSPSIIHTKIYRHPLSKEFMLMTASLLALPLTWYFGKEWLQNFAYRSPMEPSNFLEVILLPNSFY